MVREEERYMRLPHSTCRVHLDHLVYKAWCQEDREGHGMINPASIWWALVYPSHLVAKTFNYDVKGKDSRSCERKAWIQPITVQWAYDNTHLKTLKVRELASEKREERRKEAALGESEGARIPRVEEWRSK